MNARIRILLALLGCLVFGANALGAELVHCDPVCCDEPCESGPLAPATDCACCAVRSTVAVDPMLPSAPPATPLPAVLPAVPNLFEPDTVNEPAGLTPAPAPAPVPVRACVLLI